VDTGANSHEGAMWGGVVGPRCHDVWANGSQWGTTRDGRGDVAAIVSGMNIWDG